MPNYNGYHRREREAWRAIVATGTVRCWRDGIIIQPGEPWDLGHRDGLPSHPEHIRCNRRAGALKGIALREPHSLTWR